ncbi:hypothetical protein BD310DRAFT_927903 [Dichomitus squalens]|uniref:Uncharacterized protein n=1 Tax=Dichomitus squalens TaxID=114155 RepID=A0A4Q9PU86_9APHY|nr:hypothetical protein BD310DRAFT_927903 [Dichomitus squalens]
MYSVVQGRLSNFSAIIFPTPDRPGNAAAVRILSREDLSARLTRGQVQTHLEALPTSLPDNVYDFGALTLLVGNTSHAS